MTGFIVLFKFNYMKKIIFSASLLLCSLALSAQDITLPAPNTQQPSKSVVEALKTRHSVRQFSSRELSLQEVSNLCWAACGISWDENHITAPTAMNRQEIRLYVFIKEGVYEYIARENKLQKVAHGDNRNLVASRQTFAAAAPVSLVMVIDFDRFGSTNEHAKLMTAVDAGIVTQNIDLYCEAVGLATVPRATMDVDAIKKLLNLTDMQLPVMNNPVGYAAE